MADNAKELSWGQALAKFAGIILAVFVIVVLSKLTMWIVAIGAAVYLVYLLVWDRPGRSG
jgi:hypothetical protein